jgi:exopolyphosphatase/guanosine-5'-triphosphate,3'-diphosphate pyrophosphatase
VTRAAAIDCGTNSIRLLVADIDDAGLHDIVRRMEIVRLGEGVDRTGRLSDAALERTFRMLDEYAATIRSTGAEAVRMVATSASRDAANRDVFTSGVEQRLGVSPEVVSGARRLRCPSPGRLESSPALIALLLHISWWTSAAARRSSCSVPTPCGRRDRWMSAVCG